MISVNQLIQNACELVSLVGDGESVDGTMAASALTQLNLLISELNSQEYLSAQCKTRDVSCGSVLLMYKLNDGEAAPDGSFVDMEPPEAIQGVSWSTCGRWQPLNSCDRQLLDATHYYSTPTYWTYDKYIEGNRLCGRLTVNSTATHTYRLFYSDPIGSYTLADTIYLSDLYNNMLLQGLTYKLCIKYKLGEYKDTFDAEYMAAKSLIKRNTVSQRALQDSIQSYDTYYNNGLHGTGW